MAEIDRLESCDHPDCACLDSFDGRLCVGRLPGKRAHLELFNTHRLCFDDDEYEINAADSYYLASLMITVLQDVKDRRLYSPCSELAIHDPVARLKTKLG